MSYKTPRLGGNFIDTANVYTNGHSEKIGNMRPGDPNAGGAARKNIAAACEESPIGETMRALDDLVASGQVRYIGFSDTPAWKTAQAQMEAHARGWTPLVARQIEYSLLERTVEGELVPMAREMGLGAGADRASVRRVGAQARFSRRFHPERRRLSKSGTKKTSTEVLRR